MAHRDDMSALELRQLACFVAVAEEGHFGRAAVRLHMSQPPLTRRIARLERALEVELFVRTPSGAKLTAAGHALLAEARRILANTSRAAEITRMVSAGAAGELVVGYYGSTGFDVVPRLLRAFSQAYPDIDVKIQQLPKTQQVDALRDGRIHVGFGRFFRDEPGMRIRQLGQEPLLLAVHASHELADLASVGIDDLVNEPIVVYPRARPSFADHVVQLFEEEGLSINIVAEAEDVVNALVYVAIGRAIAFVPHAGTHAALPDVRFLPVKGARGLHVHCVHLEDDRIPALESFLGFTDAWMAEGARQPP